MLGEAAIAFALLAGAAPLAADPAPIIRWAVPPEPRVSTPGVSLPVIDYVAPDGSLKIRRGIIAGKQIAPNATVGIGLFDTLPKTQRLTPFDNPLERKPKRSRKAAVGFSLSF